MNIRLTNKKESESIYFIDQSKKHLRVVSCAFIKGNEFVDELELEILFYFSPDEIKKRDENSMKHKLPFSSYKEGIPSKLGMDIYFNEKYNIPKDCSSVSLSIKSKNEYEIDCIVLLD